MVYPALLPLTRTPRLPAVDLTDSPADLNGLVRFAERRSLVSARVPSHFKRSRTAYGLTYNIACMNTHTLILNRLRTSLLKKNYVTL